MDIPDHPHHGKCRAEITIRLYETGSQMQTTVPFGSKLTPEQVIDGAVDALIGERRDLVNCPAHKPATVDKRPVNCRNRLRDEGKAHPRSGCAYCGDGGMRGCPLDSRKAVPIGDHDV